MHRICRLITVVLFVVGTLLAGVMPNASASPLLPRAMAATGDSITRAFNVGWCCVLRDEPSRSWSTGWSSLVDSHYRRLLPFDARLAGHAYNDAVSGARMGDLGSQVARAASQRVDYLTIEMGANDLCRSSIAAMTPTLTFETQFRTALASFVAARPKARILVASIPDVYRLWQLFHTNLVAVATWTAAGICQSMLSISNTETMRQQVVAQETAYNDALARVCAEFRQCRWDGGAVYKFQFTTGDVSTVDYFHPSTQGQNDLAAVTWAAGYWPTL